MTGARGRLLVIDDEEDVREMLEFILSAEGFEVATVDGGLAAVELARARPFDLAITDMRMPGMNGAELLEVVQREYPDTIRLILSGQAETESVMKALGVSHQFLSKPCDAEILQGTISRAFALRDLAGSESVKALVARINKLPTLPSTYQKLVETLKQPNSSIEDVSSVIATDPAMTARLLKLVNSAYFGLAKPVADVTRAGALLGLDRIMALVLGQGIFSDCDPPKVEGFSMDALWSHSVTTAAAAHRIAIAEHMDRDQVAAAFLAGMLHDIGKLVLAMGLPEQYAKVLKHAGDRPGELQQIEMLELRAAHTDVGAYLVGLWGLPNTIAEAIAYHEDPTQSPNAGFGLSGIVHVADRLAHRPDITDVRSPELGLNLAYLESQKRIDRWNEWREACAPTMPGKSS